MHTSTFMYTKLEFTVAKLWLVNCCAAEDFSEWLIIFSKTEVLYNHFIFSNNMSICVCVPLGLRRCVCNSVCVRLLKRDAPLSATTIVLLFLNSSHHLKMWEWAFYRLLKPDHSWVQDGGSNMALTVMQWKRKRREKNFFWLWRQTKTSLEKYEVIMWCSFCY